MKPHYVDVPLTNEFIIDMVVLLLHLAYKAQLAESDDLLYQAQERFVRELYQQEQEDQHEGR
jgi:hypothetical protein